MRTALIVSFRAALFIAGGSLAYLLFMFGHAEPEVIPIKRILLVAAAAGVSALVAGILQWVGLPEDPTAKTKKGTAKR